MNSALIIVCVKWGDMYPPNYANILYDMVKRNLPDNYPFTFMCFTESPENLHPNIIIRELPGDLKSWWNKLYLFKEGVFSEGQTVFYLDLDTIITGKLDEIVKYRGNFAILRDFYYPEDYGSGIMMWRGGTNHHIWSVYEEMGKPTIKGGDQAWIKIVRTGADLLQDLFPGVFASYKVHCNPLPPQGTRIVCFHGQPKPDNCGAGWVKNIWKIDIKDAS